MAYNTHAPAERRTGRAAFIVLGGLLAMGIPAEARAQEGLSWKCDFPDEASMDWAEEGPTVDTQEFSFFIDNVDIVAGTARLIGNAGSTDLQVISTPRGVHFLESTPSGNLNVTTLFKAPGWLLEHDMPSGPASLKAVHSRHISILGDPVPSQNYGSCVPWN